MREDLIRRACDGFAESDWLAIEFGSDEGKVGQSIAQASQLTVQELLQEREITYRNLLAAYLKLQEVNRQKTVFLASAAHELKTPLAVIKGYYDLLLDGIAGKTDGKTKRHSGRIERKLRAAGAAGVDVPELFRAGEREIGVAAARERSARLPGRDGQPLVGSVPAQRSEAGERSLILRFRRSDSIIKKCSRLRPICWTTR